MSLIKLGKRIGKNHLSGGKNWGADRNGGRRNEYEV